MKKEIACYVTTLEKENIKAHAAYFNISVSKYISHRVFNRYIKDKTQSVLHNTLMKMRGLIYISNIYNIKKHEYKIEKKAILSDSYLSRYSESLYLSKTAIVKINRSIKNIISTAKQHHFSNQEKISNAKKYLFITNQNSISSIKYKRDEEGKFVYKNELDKRNAKITMYLTEHDYIEFFNLFDEELTNKCDFIFSKLFVEENKTLIFDLQFNEKILDWGRRFKYERDNNKIITLRFLKMLKKFINLLDVNFLNDENINESIKNKEYNGFIESYINNSLEQLTLQQNKILAQQINNIVLDEVEPISSDEFQEILDNEIVLI